jgi:hypothetical protein
VTRSSSCKRCLLAAICHSGACAQPSLARTALSRTNGF